MNIDSILQFVQENRVLVGYLVIGSLFLILLIFLFIKSITAPKQPALAASPTASMSKMAQKSMPHLSEQPDTKLFIDQLRKVSDESQKIIYKLDTEIAEKEKLIVEKTNYIQALEQQVAQMPIEQIIGQHSEKMKKESEKKLAQVKQEALSKAYRMWFLGFMIGLLVAGGMGAAYYFVVLKG